MIKNSSIYLLDIYFDCDEHCETGKNVGDEYPTANAHNELYANSFIQIPNAHQLWISEICFSLHRE